MPCRPRIHLDKLNDLVGMSNARPDSKIPMLLTAAWLIECVSDLMFLDN